MTAAPKKKRGRPPRERPARKADADATPIDPNATLIKKYGNRRLYDTRRSRYVTLDEVREVVARGEEIVVVDETTGEDVTKRVMTQIILQEEEAQHLNILPLNFLKKLIQYRDESLRDYFQKYLSASLDTFLGAQRAMAGTWDPSSTPPAIPGLPPVPPGMAAMFPWFNLASLGATPPAPPPVAAPQHAPPAENVADEVAELRRRLADLEHRTRK